MFSLRCTKKLLARMRIDPEPNPLAPSTILGDWYANLLYTGGRQLILAVSERTLLPVLLPAIDAKSIPSRLPTAVRAALAAIEIPSGAIDRELGEMSDFTISTTANRRVVGSMTDFAWMLEVPMDRGESLASAAAFLAECPCKPIGMESPRFATKAAFAESVH